MQKHTLTGFQLHSHPVIEEGAVPYLEKETVAPVTDWEATDMLPKTYGIDTIYLVAQEPHQLFTYWDIDISCHPGGKIFLRVYGGYDKNFLEQEIEVSFEARNWHIPVKVASGFYRVEIGYYRGTKWNAIASSYSVQTPADTLSESHQFDYATVPLHRSLSQLASEIHGAAQGPEALAHTLARLQKNEQHPAFFKKFFVHLSEKEFLILEGLLGATLLGEMVRGAWSPAEMALRIHQHLKEKINSEGSSDILAHFPWKAVTGLLSSEAFSARESTFGETEQLSSWKEALASWAAAAAFSSGGSEIFSLAPESASWAEAALARESPETSSWLHAAETSWTGGSESISSFSQQAEREFFMHVNAEVIFYGGTHPHAKVMIGGKPLTLNSDGSFRYHCILPDGNYEIPIVAESPDKGEVRRAILSFQRKTQKEGEVGDTSQPPLVPPSQI